MIYKNYKNIYLINTCVNTEFKIVKTTKAVNIKTNITKLIDFLNNFF